MNIIKNTLMNKKKITQNMKINSVFHLNISLYLILIITYILSSLAVYLVRLLFPL